jgi:hypothetical protein
MERGDNKIVVYRKPRFATWIVVYQEPRFATLSIW